MCRFFGVSRSGYYAHIERAKRPAFDQGLADKISPMPDTGQKDYGYRRIHMWLDKHGIHRNPKTVLRVIQKYGLLSEVRHRKYRYMGEHLHKYPNILNRQFSAEPSNQK